MENLVDWTTLDSDMIGIRSRGVSSRRLDRIERPQQLTIEIINYAIPAFLVIGLGVWRFWRRKETVPLIDGIRSTASQKEEVAQLTELRSRFRSPWSSR